MNSHTRVEKAFNRQLTDKIPRGELWIGSEIFQNNDIKDNLEGHIEMRARLGMDLLFLPISEKVGLKPAQGYRYFTIFDLKRASITSRLYVAVIIDGPFQRLVDKKGLLVTLKEWTKDRESLAIEYEKESEKVCRLLSSIMELEVGIVVIADDMAYEKSTYLSPKDIRAMITPFYSRAIDQIHAGGSYALLHSCGNIHGIIPHMVALGIDGLAGCQTRAMDLVGLKNEYSSRLTFLTGIDSDLLQTESIITERKKAFHQSLKTLTKGGGFILCSSCGLYSKDLLMGLTSLYKLADEAVEPNF